MQNERAEMSHYKDICEKKTFVYDSSPPPTIPNPSLKHMSYSSSIGFLIIERKEYIVIKRVVSYVSYIERLCGRLLDKQTTTF